MLGPLKDLFAVLALIAALFTLRWFTEPGFQPARMGETSGKIMEQSAVIKGHCLTPAEQTKVTNCDEQ